jgi:hypothetical protein
MKDKTQLYLVFKYCSDGQPEFQGVCDSEDLMGSPKGWRRGI